MLMTFPLCSHNKLQYLGKGNTHNVMDGKQYDK